mmetsp:Transcript_22670/g.51834  ORF Transcript_22670/g.51834 Transcript_22670/m.51834 type:complete len:91 (-) Transcript_22670:133-405(-)
MAATVRVLLFGPAREAMDAGHVEVALVTADSDGKPCVADLRQAMVKGCPPLSDLLPTSRFSVDQELVQDEAGTALSAELEVALIPPVSGG